MTGKILAPLLSVLVHIAIASAQAQEFAQCGGIGWTGATTCVAGTSCVQLNPYFFQCLSSSSTGSGGSSSTSTSAGALPTGSSTAFTNTVAKGIGKLYFGSATDNPELPDTAYETILNNTGFFGQITPGNSMKWDATEPEEGVFTFSGGDQIANLARANGQLIRGHNCVWYNQLPAWVSNGVFTAAQLTTVIQNHCGTLVSHYAGEIYAWDVINEPFNDDGTWRSDVFFNTLGESFVSIALEAARAADPKAKLYINDYNLEFTGAKNTAMMNLIKSLKAAEVPVDGVGLQGHFIVGEVPSNLATILQGFVALGVEVAITELDVRMTLPETDALLAQQKADYQTVAAACKAVAGCVGITIWDYTDKYSWIPGTFPGQGAACPWDANFVRKPAYDGIIAGLSA